MTYLDHHASTPLDPRVLDAMLPVLRHSANPASSHAAGTRARRMVDEAREQLAVLVGLPASGVIFCSGATEANNLSLRSFSQDARGRRGVRTSKIEHPSVLVVAEDMQSSGHPVDVFTNDRHGRVDPGMIAPNDALVCVQAANGEIGTVQPVAALAEAVHANEAILHVDAAQALIGIDVPLHLADAVTVSSHKMYGPQGVGALILRPELLRRVRPQILGGGQESGARSGTLNLAGIVGMGKAAALAVEQREADRVRLQSLRDRLRDRLDVAGATLNGPVENRLPGNLNVRFADADADAVILACPQVAFSAGSACAAHSNAPSRVLQAIGLTAQAADESLRFGIGRHNTLREIEEAAGLILAAVGTVRERMAVVA